jgi:hypothetical protein
MIEKLIEKVGKRHKEEQGYYDDLIKLNEKPFYDFEANQENRKFIHKNRKSMMLPDHPA